MKKSKKDLMMLVIIADVCAYLPAVAVFVLIGVLAGYAPSGSLAQVKIILAGIGIYACGILTALFQYLRKLGDQVKP